MKKIVRLSESDLNRLVKRVINEQDNGSSEDSYRMYDRFIQSEVKNINDSIDELHNMLEDIEIDDNLDEHDKKDLLDQIHSYLRQIGY